MCFVFLLKILTISCRVAIFVGQPRNLEKLGKQKNYQGKVRKFVWLWKIAFATKNLILTLMTCLMYFGSTAVCDLLAYPANHGLHS
jgi:hypothetical protein